MAEFRWFCLSEPCRGQGAGRKVLAGAIGWAAQRDLQRLVLHTHRDLGASVHLYERAGFQQVGGQPGPARAPYLRFEAYELQIGCGRLGHKEARQTMPAHAVTQTAVAAS